MKYLVVERQHGGCDYTIGCGVNITFVTADSIEDAGKVYMEEYEDGNPEEGYNPLKGEMSVNEVEIYEITEKKATINMEVWNASIENRVAAAKAKQKESQEREELERLKKKYG